MKRLGLNIFGQVLCLIAAGLLVLSVNVASVLAKEEIKPTIEIQYDPIEYFVPEHRIRLKAEVTDDEGINLVRCYFRAAEQADYVFVAMTPGSSLYQGILPAPSKETERLEYLFLAVNGKDQVVKTQPFKVSRKDEDKIPAWQQVSPEGVIRVTTELPQATEAPPGFTDSIAMDVAESSTRFGFVVGGIYSASQVAAAGGSAGAAAAATSAGTVSASAGGISTLGYVGIGIGVAAVAGGVAAVAGGGSDDGDGGDTTTTTTSTTTIPHATTTTTSTTTIPHTTTTSTTTSTTTTSTTTVAQHCTPPGEWSVTLVHEYYLEQLLYVEIDVNEPWVPVRYDIKVGGLSVQELHHRMNTESSDWSGNVRVFFPYFSDSEGYEVHYTVNMPGCPGSKTDTFYYYVEPI